MSLNPCAVAFALIMGIAPGAAGQGAAEELSRWDRHRLRCSLPAAERYGIPASALLAVASLEGGRPGQWSRNRNGTYDVGFMQFNTRYLRSLQRRFGITAQDVAQGDCYPFELAAWRLRHHLDHDEGDMWTRLANYHSRTKAHNAQYRQKLIRRARGWERWLRARGGRSRSTGSN